MNRKIENILKSPTDKRYRYFLHTVVDSLELWGYFSEEKQAWEVEEETGCEAVLLFPEKMFADLYALENTVNGVPKSINLYEFLYEWRSCFGENARVSLYGGTMASKVSAETLISDIFKELDKY